jgi:pyruvate/2-oxoglutarate dehydrogenase complex dihydrolipoamide acyltransferase (E2) component
MRIVPFSKNRELIYGLLTRAKKFHAPITIVLKMDVTELLAALERERDEGRRITLLAYLVKATSVLLEKHPRLNHHLFHGLVRKYEVDFDEISCNLVVLRRGEGGERILLPVVLRDSNRLSLEQINQEIRRFRRTPLAELPEVQAIQRSKQMPLVAMKYFSFKCRSDARFYRRYFGTYGLSSILHDSAGKVALNQVTGQLTQIYANTAAAFLPTAVAEEARVVAGELRVRKVLTVSTIVDHHLVDGHDALFALEDLTEMVEQAQLLETRSELAAVR